MGKLDGRVALITGASSGIGEATAVSLAGEGAAVALVARRHDRLVKLAGRIEDEGGKALPLEADVSDHGKVEALVGEVAGQLGGLHILVNNAGVMLLGPVDGADVGEWRRMVDVNVLGLLYCTREALPVIRDSGGGHIVNISSVAGRTTGLGSAVYNLTKWGVTGFSDALRQEALHSKIRVTCIEPGFVDTELQGHNENPVVVDALEKAREQAGDVLEAGDIAEAIRYAVTQPERVNVNEVLIRPTGQQR
ncbi:MAG: SDR family NAD(P)-dependent oxidoreductase [Actinomycetota bacterium]|nr:SDR family NAD(P)-dependent oxidoreductase [Actinomycetota bacterium]